MKGYEGLKGLQRQRIFMETSISFSTCKGCYDMVLSPQRHTIHVNPNGSQIQYISSIFIDLSIYFSRAIFFTPPPPYGYATHNIRRIGTHLSIDNVSCYQKREEKKSQTKHQQKRRRIHTTMNRLFR